MYYILHLIHIELYTYTNLPEEKRKIFHCQIKHFYQYSQDIFLYLNKILIIITKMKKRFLYTDAHGGVIGAGFCIYDITTALTLNINDDKTYK